MVKKKETYIDEKVMITSGDFAGLTHEECIKIINSVRDKKQDIHDAIEEYRKDRKGKVGQGE
jgi:hypothetical protein